MFTVRTLKMFALLVPTLWSALAFSDARESIQKLEDTYAEAYNRGDAAAVAQLYTEDAKFLPQDVEMLSGRKAIEAQVAQDVKGLGELKLTTVEVQVLNADVTSEIGTFTAVLRQQPTQKLAGKYIVIWRKTGDKWLIANDIFNYVLVK